MGDDWKVDDFKSYIYNYLLGLNNPLGYVPVIEQKNNHDTLGTYNRKLIKDISKGIGSADKYYKLYQSDIMDFAAKYKGEDEKDKDEKDKDEKDKNKKGVDITIILGQLVRLLPTAIVHSHITTTFLGNKSILADGSEIKKGKMRGVVSNGMFCSEEELGIAGDEPVHGLMILPEDAPLGMDIKEYLKWNINKVLK